MRRFQSTLPVRGATEERETIGADYKISIHAPRAGSDVIWKVSTFQPPISIHAPRAGSDSFPRFRTVPTESFQSTLPVRGATTGALVTNGISVFQSTLPVRGATTVDEGRASDRTDFNPRSPCGERPCQADLLQHLPVFQSTLPVRGATDEAAQAANALTISIHAPRAGSDV